MSEICASRSLYRLSDGCPFIQFGLKTTHRVAEVLSPGYFNACSRVLVHPTYFDHKKPYEEFNEIVVYVHNEFEKVRLHFVVIDVDKETKVITTKLLSSVDLVDVEEAEELEEQKLATLKGKKQ